MCQADHSSVGGMTIHESNVCWTENLEHMGNKICFLAMETGGVDISTEQDIKS